MLKIFVDRIRSVMLLGMLRVPLCRQSTTWTCGCAALQSVLRWFGVDTREDTLVERCNATPDEGTHYKRMMAVAREEGIDVVARTGMSIRDLRTAINAGSPVIIAVQAWAVDVADAGHPVDYTRAWDDGHYVVVIGWKDGQFVLMDPSTLGNYCCLSEKELEERWHDFENDEETHHRVDLVHFGMTFSGTRRFDPDAILYMG